MRIGLIYTNKSEFRGGGYTFQEELLKEISKNKNVKIKYFLFNTKKFNRKKNDYYQNKFEIIYLIKKNFFHSLLENLIHNFSFFSERTRYKTVLDKACKKFNIDLILFLDNSHNLHTNFPYITIVYDLDHLNYPFFPEYSQNYAWYKRENRLSNHLRKASAIITGTNYGISEIYNYYGIPKHKIFKLPHPSIELETKENNEKPKKYSLDKLSLTEKKYIIYPAQFWSHKNHISLVSLGKLLKKKYDNEVKIVLTGKDKGNLNYILDEIKKNNLEDLFVVPGFIEKDFLILLYKNALALSYVSYGGPENLPPLEAFSVGCPVIATKNDASMEQLGDAAVLIDPNNSEEFLTTVEKIINDKNFRDNLILKGKEKSKSWSISNFVDGLTNILLNFEKYIKSWKCL